MTKKMLLARISQEEKRGYRSETIQSVNCVKLFLHR